MRSAIILFFVAAVLFADAAAGLKWTAPAGWVSKGAAPMRAATYGVQDAECVVYYFGPGQGGSVEANTARWANQFTRDGKPAQSKIAKRVVHGLPVTTVETSGTYTGMGGPAMTPQAAKPGYRLLAAIVEGPQGNIFIKFTGPERTLEANRRKFEVLIASFQKQ